MTDRAVMQQALEALEPVSTFGRVGSRDVDTAKAQEAITALQEALAEQPARPQPVAGLLVGQDSDGRYVSIAAKASADTLPLGEYKLYTAPPARKPLTDEEIETVWRSVQANDFHDCVKPFARAIEAAHNIKGDA